MKKLNLAIALSLGMSAIPPTLADLDDGLVAHYEFEGNANDSSGHGNHGTEQGSVNYVAGKIGQAVKLDGIDDYVEVANSPSLELNRQLTISYVIAPQPQPVPARPNWGLAVPVVMKGRHIGNNYSGWIDGKLNSVWFQQYPNGAAPRHTFGVLTSLAAGEFVRVTMLRDGDKIRIYLNCKLLSEYEANYDAKEKHEPLFIGHDGGYGYRKFKGVLDDLRVYDRALSESEIQQLVGGCTCQLYAVHDEGLNDSQLFTVSPETFEVKALGGLKNAHDIEALDIHPQTGELYAASGRHTNKPGHLYKVDKATGELTDIGPTGFDEIDGLSFAPDGTLWGWAQDVGLLIINTSTGKAEVVVAYAGEIEDLTWNTAGTVLYGVGNLGNGPDAGWGGENN